MADINHSIQISAPPEQIYPLGATAQGLTKWWAEVVTQPSADLVALSFFGGATIYRLRSATAQPPNRVEWVCESGDEWGGTRISFHIEAVKGGSLLRFAHAGWRAPTDYFCSCNTTWGELMFRLKAAAEGKSRGPLFSRDGWDA